MNNPFDDRIADALHAEARLAPDPSATHAEFLQRRRRHQQRLVTAGAVAAAILITAGALVVASHHNGKATPVAATDRTTAPQPLAGGEGTDAASSTTSTAAPAVPTTVAGGAAVPPSPRTTKAPSPTTSTTAAPNLSNDTVGILVVTEADDGKTFTLHRGNQGILVRLSNDNVWTEPQASDANVLTRTSGSTNSDGSAEATFMATGDGQATVSADGRSHPLPCETAQPPCMVPDHIVHFHVNVNVVG